MTIIVQKKSKPQSAAPSVPAASPTKKPWYVKGDSTAGAIQKEDKRIEEKIANQYRMFRFWLEADKTISVTFVDGGLTDKGVLDCFMYREHQLFLNGKWTNWYVCTAEQEPCPICETGDDPSLVGVFTIIDHSEFKGKKAIYKDTPKLFVAKRGTLKQLQIEATKRGGLSGCTFDVTRSSTEKPNVGDMFSFTVKTDLNELRKKYVKKVEDPKTKKVVVKSVFEVANYEEEIKYYPAVELRKLGFGKGTPIGGEGPVSDAKAAGAAVEEALG